MSNESIRWPEWYVADVVQKREETIAKLVKDVSLLTIEVKALRAKPGKSSAPATPKAKKDPKTLPLTRKVRGASS